MYNQTKIVLMILVIGWLTTSCIEEIPLSTETFEDILVIEAIITNEYTNQEIQLSRVYPFEQNQSIPEENAEIVIEGDDGIKYSFSENSAGTYTSDKEFAAQLGTGYILSIFTEGGQIFRSKIETLTGISALENVNASRIKSTEGGAGVLITVDSKNTENNGYFLYQYAETYKIISPYESDSTLTYERINDTTYVFDLIPKTKKEEICYNTVRSSSLLVASTENLVDKAIADFPIRFLEQNNPYIANRYSILISQYAVSGAAFRFYSTLKDLSQSTDVFVQNQPGFLEGNIFPVQQGEGGMKVLGFFSVASIDKKRIFFDYEDFFPTEDDRNEKGRLVFGCAVSRPQSPELYKLLSTGVLKFYRLPPPDAHPVEGSGPYRVVPANCIDCTLLGTNVKPEFWEE